jgi:hypothetical protein
MEQTVAEGIGRRKKRKGAGQAGVNRREEKK